MNNKVEYTSKFQYEASPISYGKDENGLKIFKPKYSDDGKILIVLNGKERELDELVPFRWMSEVELTKEQAEKAIEGTVGFKVAWAEHYEGKMNFGSAIEALKLGEKVTRSTWYGSEAGPVVMLQVPDENSKMTKPYLYMSKNNGKDVFPLDLSCESVLAEDWIIIE